jgi:DNA-binding response OmpR family regulator
MSSTPGNNRRILAPDRRRFPRGGRRETDRPGRHPRIAIIDQYEGVRQPCARYLEHFNFDVCEGPDPELGFRLMESEPPALFLLEEPQSAAIARLHAQAAALSIPCISLVTAIDASVAADGALVKPFTLSAMLDEIRRLLGARMRASAGSPPRVTVAV